MSDFRTLFPSIQIYVDLALSIRFALLPAMGRASRISDTTLHYHVIARCNNRAFLFEDDEDFYEYLSLLHLVQKKHDFKIFNYELMNSHVHLFLQPGPKIPFHKTMQLIQWRYSMKYNRRKNRKGHFWINRYQCIPVESDRYSLALMRYINRNPIRAGMVTMPGEWKWSAYRFYAMGETNELITPHVSYLLLGESEEKRRQEYQNFVKDILPTEDRRSLNFTEVPYIGSKEFGEKLP